jgi:Tripartite tricarboxylate transporter family receptor
MVNFARRRFLQFAGGAAAASAIPQFAWALDYPTRPVRLVVGFPPGGSADIVTRLIAQSLTERLGQSFIVDNRPGAGSNIGTEAVVRADPDGYTLLSVSVANAINATLYSKLNFDYMRDFAPVASIDIVPNVMEVNPSVPAKTVPEFIAYAKANPGKISMASGGIGSSPHVEPTWLMPLCLKIAWMRSGQPDCESDRACEDSTCGWAKTRSLSLVLLQARSRFNVKRFRFRRRTAWSPRSIVVRRLLLGAAA